MSAGGVICRQASIDGCWGWRTAQRGAHAEDAELGGGAGGDGVDGAAVPRAGVGRVVVIVDVACHEVEDVKEAAGW